eukprot:6087775-Pyramimonas_sp.AAC.1
MGLSAVFSCFAAFSARSQLQWSCDAATAGGLRFAPWNTRTPLRYEGAHAGAELSYLQRLA